MASKTFNQSVNTNYSESNNWTPVGVPGAGDDVLIPDGKSCTYDYDGSAITLNSVTVGGGTSGSLTASRSMTTHLKTIKMTTKNGSTTDWGSRTGTLIPSSYTATIELAVTATATEGWDSQNGCIVKLGGTPTYSLAGSAWSDCYSTLSADAASGQPTASITDTTMAARGHTGDKWIIQGTTSWNQDEVKEWSSQSGGTVTFSSNFSNTHTSGAWCATLARNVVIKSSDPSKLAYIDDDNNVTSPGWDCYFAEFGPVYYVDFLTAFRMEGCTVHCEGATNTYGVIARDGTNATFTKNIIANSYHWGAWAKVFASNCWLAKGTYTANGALSGDNFMHLDHIMYSGANWGITNAYGPAILTNNEMRGVLVAARYGTSITAYDLLTTNATYGVVNQVANCAFYYFTAPSTAAVSSLSMGARAAFIDYNRTHGAAEIYVGQLGVIKRQSSVVPSGETYAMSLTPEASCVKYPLDALITIDCTHGDTVLVTAQGGTNASYPAGVGPYIELDPFEYVGAHQQSSQNANTQNNTFVEMSASATVNFGSAGTRGGLLVRFAIGDYAAGAVAYIGKIRVSINGEPVFKSGCESFGPDGPLLTKTSETTLDDIYDRLGAPTGASISADIAAVQADVDAVLVDTGTDIPADLTDISNLTKAAVALAAIAKK